MTDALRRARPTLGRDPELHTPLTAVLAEGDAPIAGAARDDGLPTEQVDEVPRVVVNPPVAMIDQSRAQRETTGNGFVSVPAAHLDDVAPVVRPLAKR